MTEVRLIYVTAPNLEVAKQLGHKAVAGGLAACANILPDMISIYEWQGKLEQEQECVLLLKTKEAKLEALTELLVKHHPYETPCVLSLPVDSGAKDFLEWIDQKTEAYPPD